jgi:hypothetical protein
MNYEYEEASSRELDGDNMTWTEPQYSKSAVGKAGQHLINPASSLEEYIESLNILDNWRASHACPLNSLTNSLRYRVKKIGIEDGIISQRLKRAESIKGKLHRSKGMQLQRMQDIGGCRATLPTIQEVYEIQKMMREGRMGHELIKEHDYIHEPKKSGYRGIHMVYKYKGRRHKAHDGLIIEVQIRSAVQHAWATSVEIAGTFLGEALKSGEGSEKWLEFFSLISTVFAEMEGYGPTEISKEEFQKIRYRAINLTEELSIIEKMEAFSVTTSESNRIGAENGYFLLTLKIESKTVEITYYPKGGLAYATEDYTKLEEFYKDQNINIVLVEAESLAGLQRSYPNYFADSGIFIDMLKKVLAE